MADTTDVKPPVLRPITKAPVALHMTPYILIVDDDARMRILVHRTLRATGLGAECLEAPDGATALEVLQSCAVDLVILDLMMPTMDGFATLAAIRERHTADEVAVVMLSGMGNEANVQRSRALGANDFLTKPCPPALLHTCCRQCLERSGRE